MAAFPHDARRDVLEHSVARFTERHEELALALCIEAGKPIRDARGEVTRLIDTFRIAAGEATRLGGEVIDMEISRRTRGYRGMAKRVRSEEHTSELQSLMRISYAVFCLKKKKSTNK